MIKDNITRARERISLVCSKINRDPESITIVAVSKNRTVEDIKETFYAGIVDIGENKVQEASDKFNEIRNTNYGQQIKWHMVGHLQTNKVKEAVKIFNLIQSVDSTRLASEIDKQAAKINKVQDILIELKTSPEENKFGLKPDDAIEAIREITKLRNISIKGLMTIAPIATNFGEARPYFQKLRELKEEINERRITNEEINILSMGMTDDFEIAIEEGSNMIRLGRGIFDPSISL